MKPLISKAETKPLGNRRDSDRGGFIIRNEPEDIRHERSSEPLNKCLRSNQFRWARVVGIELRNASGITGRE